MKNEKLKIKNVPMSASPNRDPASIIFDSGSGKGICYLYNVAQRHKHFAFCILHFALIILLTTPIFAQPEVSVTKGRVFLSLKDADIKSVLQIFAKATGVNIVASDDVSGKITVSFSGVNPKQGLEAILRTKGLDWFEDAGTIFVSTKKIMRTYYLANAKPSDLQATIAAILPEKSVVTADDSYNVLVIQTSSDYLPRLEKLITELDVPPIQVEVETRILQLRHTNAGSLGLDVKSSNKNDPNDSLETKNLAGRPTDATAQGLYGKIISIFSATSLEAYLSALVTGANYNVVASPRLTTLNNKEAAILIGQKIGYKTTVTSNFQTTTQINFLPVGTSLTLTPNVTKNGFIRMKVAPKISQGEIINEVPNEETTETKNEVMVRDGQTFVIGGLVKESDTQIDYGVPFLMDIPVLGGLFRKTVTNKEKNEILVFVTPHIVTPEYLEKMNEPIEEMKQRGRKQKANLIH